MNKIKYGSYPRNSGFGDLPIEYEQRLFTKVPIDHLNNIILEISKVVSIRRSLYNIIYKSNPQNADSDDLPFDGDERLVARR